MQRVVVPHLLCLVGVGAAAFGCGADAALISQEETDVSAAPTGTLDNQGMKATSSGVGTGRMAADSQTAVPQATVSQMVLPSQPAPAGTQLGGDCTTVRREALGQVGVSTKGQVVVVEDTSAWTLLYVDASAGGFQESANNPYVYVNLADAKALPVTDFDADKSSNWDLAFKRFTVRTNSGDSGPASGGAALQAGSFDSVTRSSIELAALRVDEFVDDETCEITPGDQGVGGIWTPFAGWYSYEEETNVLTPLSVPFVVRGANGRDYFKLQILNYYGTPKGTTGQVSARYLVQYARL